MTARKSLIMDNKSNANNTRKIKASRLLQSKVGSGPVDPKIITKSQKIIDNNEVDFPDMARDFLSRLEKAIEGGGDEESILSEMIEPVMEIKANAAMFDYPLVGNLANVMMNFLEAVESVDDDVIEIAKAHLKTLTLILDNGMKGDGGQYGKELTNELKDACKRYFARQASKGNIIEDRDAFFIDG